MESAALAQTPDVPGEVPEEIPAPSARQRLRFGSAPDNDVVLVHPEVAEHHAEVLHGAEGLQLRDTTTTASHGTRLNGQLVAGAILAEGDVLTIGPWAFELRSRTFHSSQVQAPPLEARGAGLAVDGRWLLRPTSLQLQHGELVAIVGPSGAGKSTLLHALAGLQRPTTGDVRVYGDDVTHRQADVGFVPQEDSVHRLLTAREALGFSARLRMPGDGQAWSGAVERALEEVGLSQHADQRIATMSGGQRKRVAVAQELIGNPAVLLLDEPTSGLDPGLDHRMMDLLRSLADSGRGVVVVTHSVAHLDACDRLLVMAPGGHVAFDGPPAEAPAAFGSSSMAEIFAHLEPAGEAPAPLPAGAAAQRPSLTGRVVARRRGWLAQAAVLTRRYALLTVRDRRNLRLLGVQALALSLGAALLFGHDVFAFDDGTAQHAGESAQLLFLMVTMAMWFGAISAARQVVAERPVLTRDLAAGVTTEAYLLSKALVLCTLTAIQTMTMALIVFALRPLGAAPGQAQMVVLLLVLVAWVGVSLGLIVSAYASTEDQATSYIPLILLPQLLFGGAIVPTAQLSGLMGLISHLAAAQWAFAGAGHSIHMNDRIAGDAVFSSASRYGHGFFGVGALTTSLILMAFIAGGAFVLQARLRPTSQDTWSTQARAWWRTRRGEDLANGPDVAVLEDAG